MLNFPKLLKWISGVICFVFLSAVHANAQTCNDCQSGNLVTSGSQLQVASDINSWTPSPVNYSGGNYSGQAAWRHSTQSPVNDNGSIKYGVLNYRDHNADYYVRQEIAIQSVVQGRPYRFTVQMTSHATGGTAEMYLEFLNSSGGVISTSSKVSTNNNYPNFQTYTITGASIPNNTAKIRIVGHSKGNALKFQVVNLTVCYNKINLTLTPTNPSCPADDGKVKATVTGGSGEFRYRIKKGNGSYENWQEAGNEYTFINRSDGTYTVQVEDRNTSSNDCKGEKTTTLTKPSPPTATAAAMNPTCDGPNVKTDGKITLSGFVNGDRYHYTTGNSYSGSATYGSGSTAIPVGGVIVSNLPNPSGPSQSYTVRIFNSSGCYIDQTVQITKVSCDCPVVAKPVVGDGSRCGAGTVQMTITTNCVSGSSLKIFSNQGLTTDITNQFTISGSTITSPSISSTATYYAACVHDTWTTCKSEGSKLTATVNANPDKPTVTNKTICLSESTTLTGTCASGTIKWYSNVGLTNEITNLTVSPASNTDYYAACISGTCKSEGSKLTVTVIKAPDITVNNPTICVGSTATLTVSGCTGGTVTWTGGLTGNPATTPVLNSNTSYEATCTITSGGTSCTSKTTATVTVRPLPTVILEAGKLTCEVKKVTMVAAATGDGITYKWNVPLSVTDPGDVASFETEFPGTYSVEVTTENGCKASDQIEVIQDSNVPTVTVNDKVIGCDETEVTLVAEGTAGVTYSWTGPGIFTADTKEISVSVAGTYKVTVTSLVNGCTATDEGVVTKKDKPGPPTSGPHKVCYGEQITLAATCASGTAKWYSDALLTQEITVLTFVPQQTHTYYAVCATQDCVSEPTQSVVTVTPDFPAPELEANPEEVIAGQNSTLSGTCQTGTLVWYKDAGLTQVLGTGATLVVTPETTTTYYAACEVEDCKKPSEIIVKVKDGIFDLALRKTVKPGQKTIFKPGDEVTFNITVFNQGNVDATNIDLVDYIPTGLTLSDANWVLDGTKARWAGAIPSLTAGADATVSITFTLNDDAVGLGVIINTAEISGAENNKGLEDIDSTPDDIKDNDGVVKNDEINEDGKKGGDEDDHDIEPISVCPDQTCLTAKAKTKK